MGFIGQILELTDNFLIIRKQQKRGNKITDVTFSLVRSNKHHSQEVFLQGGQLLCILKEYLVGRIRKGCSSASKLQVVRGNSAESWTAPWQPPPGRHRPHGRDGTPAKKSEGKKKNIYLWNAPSGLFTAVDGARPRESQYPPRLPAPLQVNQSDCCTEWGTYHH